MTQLNRDAAEAAVRSRRPGSHRRHRFRPARPPLTRCAAPPGGRGDRPRCGAARRRSPGGAAGRLRLRRDPAQPRLGAAAPDTGAGITEDDLLLLADAQTSGGLLVVGELPGHPVIGHTVAGPGHRDPLDRPPASAAGGDRVVGDAGCRRAASRRLLRFDRVPRILGRGECPPRIRRTGSAPRRPATPGPKPPPPPRCRPPSSVPEPAGHGQPLAPFQHGARPCPGAGARPPPGPSAAPSPAWRPRHRRRRAPRASGPGPSPRTGVVTIASPAEARLAELTNTNGSSSCAAFQVGCGGVAEQHRRVRRQRSGEQRRPQSRPAPRPPAARSAADPAAAVPGHPVDLRRRRDARAGAEGAEDPRADAHRRGQLDGPQHVQEAFRPAEVLHQGDGAEAHRGQGGQPGSCGAASAAR